MTRKRIVIAAAILLTLLVGLYTQSLIGYFNTQSDKPNSETSNEDTEPVELTLWRPSRTTDHEFMMNDEFMKAHPKIKLNVIVREGDPGNDYFQAFAAGNAPDVVLVSWSVLPKYINEGIALDITHYIDEWEDRKLFGSEYMERGMQNGKIYGIPNGIGAPMLFAYNKRLFEQAGLEKAPQNWNEILEYAKLLTKPEDQQYGYGMMAARWTEWWFQYYAWQAGGDLTKKNEDGTLELTFDDPAVIEAAKFYKQLRKERVIQSDLTLDYDALMKNFAAGKCGMMIIGADLIGWLQSMGMKVEDIGLAPLPKGPSGKRTTSISGAHFIINPRISKAKQDAAWEYIKWQTSKEYLTGYLKYTEVNNVVNPIIIEREDVKVGEIVKISREWLEASEESIRWSRDEFYGKSAVGVYIDKALQKIIYDPNADPEKEFRDAEETANREVLKQFNDSIKGRKNGK